MFHFGKMRPLPLVDFLSLPNLPLLLESKIATTHFAKKYLAFARQKYACTAGYNYYIIDLSVCNSDTMKH